MCFYGSTLESITVSNLVLLANAMKQQLVFNGSQASKQAYLFVNKNDRLPKKPLAQQCWQPIVSTTVKKKSAHTQKKIYIYISWPHHITITLH